MKKNALFAVFPAIISAAVFLFCSCAKQSAVFFPPEIYDTRKQIIFEGATAVYDEAHTGIFVVLKKEYRNERYLSGLPYLRGATASLAGPAMRTYLCPELKKDGVIRIFFGSGDSRETAEALYRLITEDPHTEYVSFGNPYSGDAIAVVSLLPFE